MTKPSMRIAACLGTAAGAFALVTLTATPAGAAPAMSAADTAFLTANQQGNIAEIALGKLGEARAQDDATSHLASKTLSDHTKLKAQLSAIATAAKATQPSAPNAMQQAVAAQLTKVPSASFDLMYAEAQVTAHRMALSAARTERDDTSNAALRSYAADYIRVATPHLTMAQDEVDALGGPPQSAPAGTGGAAATNAAGGVEWGWVAGGGTLVVAAGAVLVLRRRDPATTR